MREDLDDGYTETLRAAYPAMPESADFVIFWWHKAALETLAGRTRLFRFITTNSIRQTFKRRFVKTALEAGLYLTFAIPDHPWIDATECAAVRIAMTVGASAVKFPVGPDLGQAAPKGSTKVEPYTQALGKLQRDTHEPTKVSADLNGGADVPTPTTSSKSSVPASPAPP